MGGRSFCNFHFHPRSTVFLVLCYAILLHHCCLFCEAAAVTDPNEVEALRIIASKMGNTKWNFNVDPCSRDPSWYTLDDREGELGVICNCAFNKNTTCHVLKIKVRYEEMTGIIPPELANLTYLENIDLRYNLLHGSIPASLGSLTRMQYLSFDSNNLNGRIPSEIGNSTNVEDLFLCIYFSSIAVT